MGHSEKEIARIALQAALDRLGPDPANPQPAGQASGAGSQVVVVVLGQTTAPPDGHAETVDGSGRAKPPLDHPRDSERSACHPVFERFPLSETAPKSSAPRSCFMEPDRACVNSGACEMLGY